MTLPNLRHHPRVAGLVDVDGMIHGIHIDSEEPQIRKLAQQVLEAGDGGAALLGIPRLVDPGDLDDGELGDEAAGRRQRVDLLQLHRARAFSGTGPRAAVVPAGGMPDLGSVPVGDVHAEDVAAVEDGEGFGQDGPAGPQERELAGQDAFEVAFGPGVGWWCDLGCRLGF